MASKKVQSTKNYRLFTLGQENRRLDLKKHRKLMESMKLYGFLACFPIVCIRDAKGNLIVKDGQHRLAIAEELGLTVYWIEETVDFDVAVVNSTAKTWVLRDYAEKFASNNKRDYQDGIDFATTHSLPIGTAFSLLAGTTSFGNINRAFIDGEFKVKDRAWADAVASVYGPAVVMAPAMKNARFIEACMAVCRVKDFDASRFLQGCERCREKLVAYSTRDAYLDMMEAIYNFGRKNLVGLKSAAIMAMRERNAISNNPSKKKGDNKKDAA